MNVGVVNIGITSIDWAALTNNAGLVLKRSVTNGLERDNLTIGPLTSFFSILGEMKMPGKRAYDYLSDPSYLVHAHAVYLIVCPLDSMMEILESAHVRGVVVNDNVMVASATFDNWLIAFTKQYRLIETQQVMNLVLAHFERIGMGPLFRDYKRVMIPKSTFRLEPR